MSEEYPQNWKQLSLEYRADSDWHCQRCDRDCTPGQGGTRSEVMRHTLQVHHRDRNPRNNDPQNRMLVCTGCHLFLHQPERRGVRYRNGQLNLFQ